MNRIRNFLNTNINNALDWNTWGTPHATPNLRPIPHGSRLEGYSHTHPNRIGFNSIDMELAADFGINFYVADPSFNIRRYNELEHAGYHRGTVIGQVENLHLDYVDRQVLQQRFSEPWFSHLGSPCGFDCVNITWPPPWPPSPRIDR